MSRRAIACVVLMLAALAGRGPTVAARQGAPQTLIRSLSAGAVPRVSASEKWEARTRRVIVNSTALPQATAFSGTPSVPGSQITIELFDGATITAVFERWDPNTTGVTWVGRVPGQEGSHVTLVYGGGRLAASIILNDASYTIRPLPIDPADPSSITDTHVLTQINDGGFLPEAPPLVPEMAATSAAQADPPMQADTSDFIDLIIVYTTLAENWAGGTAGINNLANLYVSEANTSLAAGDVQTRIRLGNVAKVPYTEVSSFETNLSSLRAGTGNLSSVPSMRNAYTADVVSMFVHPAAPSACGIGFIMTSPATSFASFAFNVVDASCSDGTLAHEIGHNMGLRHDWYMDNGTTPFTYAHGYVNIPGRFRTVMSYPNACTAAAVGCTRLLAFSNPSKTFNGQPMGIAGGTNASCPISNVNNMSCDADESRALNITAPTVANFVQFSTLRPPLIQGQPQSQAAVRNQAVTLQVTADGVGPFTYQWYRGASPVKTSPMSGATGSSVTFVPGADGVYFERSYYWVEVTNAIGSVSSLTATVTIVAPGQSASQSNRAQAARDGTPARSSTANQPASQPARGSQRVLSDPGGSTDGVVVQLPTPDSVDVDACSAAALDVTAARTSLALSAGDVQSTSEALVRLVAAVGRFAEQGCGGGRGHRR